MKNFSLVIFILSIILISNFNSKSLHKNKKHKRFSAQHKSKAMTKQDITAYDNCVVEYNAALFCKFEYPNDPSPMMKDCIRDNIKQLKKSEFCVTCIKKFFTKLLNKVNIFVSLSQEDPNSYNAEIDHVKKESKRFIFDLLLFTTKNCEYIPKNLEQAYFEFIKLTESPKCLAKADNFVAKLEKIFGSTYSGPEVLELNACPKVKSIADSVFGLLTTPCEQDVPNFERLKDRKDTSVGNQRIESKKIKEKEKEREVPSKRSEKKFRLVADLAEKLEEQEEPTEPTIPALRENQTEKNSEQDEPENGPYVPVNSSK